MNSKLCNLRLVAPAFSNWEIEELKSNDDYTHYFERSNLYMIVQRKEIIFSDFKYFIKINKTGLHFIHNCNKWSFDG